MQLDIAGDMESVFDNLEIVTLRRTQPGGTTFTDTPGVIALRRATKRMEREGIPRGGRMSVVSVRFHLDVDTAGPVPPKPRDRIQDASGVEFAVDSCTVVTAGTRYQVDAIRLPGEGT